MKKLILAAMVMSVSGGVMAVTGDATMTDTHTAPDLCSIELSNSDTAAFGDVFTMKLLKDAVISANVTNASNLEDLTVVQGNGAALPNTKLADQSTIRFNAPSVALMNSGEVIAVSATITADCQ